MASFSVGRFILSCCLFFSFGCAYRWQPDYPGFCRPSLSVQMIGSDDDGLFLGELIRALTVSGLVDFCVKGGDYRLVVKSIDSLNEVIGYRKDHHRVSNKIETTMTGCEARISRTVEVIVYKGDSEEIAYGPYVLLETSDYDYIDGDSYQDLTFLDSFGKMQSVLPFSLGQLEPYESAQSAALRPLYSHLAQKVVDVISSEW